MANVFEYFIRVKDDGATDTLHDVEEAGADIGETLLGLGAAGAGLVLTGHVEDTTVSLGQLQAQLGLTESQTQELGSVARTVYKNNFGDSIGEATQVTGLLHQALGTTGSELASATEDVFRITDAFGHLGAEPDIITENVRTMKAAFPDMTDAEILDTIAKGFQDGAGRSGDLQDTLQEYPRFFSEIGLSAQDMTNFLTTGMDAGARNSDLLGDAVKEMGIIIQETGSDGQLALQEMFGADQADQLIANFAAGGEAGREAFFTILEGLNEIEDPMERNAAAVDLFGTKGEDLAGVLDDMLPSFLATKDASQEVGDVTGSLDAQYVGMGSTLEGVKRQFESFIAGPLGGVSAPAQEAITAFGGVATGLTGLSAIGVDVGGMISGLGTKMLGAIAPTNLMAGAQAALNLVMSANPILLVVLALTALVGGLIIAYRESETFRNIVNGVWSSVSDTVQPVLDFLTTEVPAAFRTVLDFVRANWPLILTIVGGPVGAMVALIITHFDTIKSTVETGIGYVQTVLGAVLGPIQANWDTVWNGIKTTIDTTWSGIETVVDLAILAVQTYIDTTLGPIRDNWDTIWNGIKTTLDTVWNGAGGVVLTVDLAINKVKGYIQTPLEAIQTTWETTWNNVSSFVGTTWDGIESRVRTGINTIIGGINGFLSGLSSIQIEVPGVEVPLGPDIPGFTIGVPDIPLLPLLNVGGLTLGDVPAQLHQNELVIPLTDPQAQFAFRSFLKDVLPHEEDRVLGPADEGRDLGPADEGRGLGPADEGRDFGEGALPDATGIGEPMFDPGGGPGAPAQPNPAGVPAAPAGPGQGGGIGDIIIESPGEASGAFDESVGGLTEEQQALIQGDSNVVAQGGENPPAAGFRANGAVNSLGEDRIYYVGDDDVLRAVSNASAKPDQAYNWLAGALERGVLLVRYTGGPLGRQGSYKTTALMALMQGRGASPSVDSSDDLTGSLRSAAASGSVSRGRSSGAPLTVQVHNHFDERLVSTHVERRLGRFVPLQGAKS